MRRLEYALRLTNEQEKYINSTILAYTIVYNIFASHKTKEVILNHLGKYINWLDPKLCDVESVKVYCNENLMPRFEEGREFVKIEEKRKDGHYIRFDTEGIKVNENSIYVPPIGDIQTFVYRKISDDLLKSIKFDREFTKQGYKYTATLKYDIEAATDGHIGMKYYGFRQEMNIRSYKTWK